MRGTVARKIRQYVNRLNRSDLDDFVKAVLNLPLWFRVRFGFSIIFKRGKLIRNSHN